MSKLGKLRPRDKTLTRWSYSAWACKNKCELQFYYSFIRGERGPKVPAMERGNEIHKLAEFFLKRRFSGVPPELKKLSYEYKGLLPMRPIVEQFWGVSEMWKPKDRDSWCVMKMDAALEPSKKTEGILWIQDLKTGRVYPEHIDQGSLYSAIGGGSIYKGDIDGVDVEFWYCDQEKGDNTVTYSFTNKQVKALVEYWREEGEKVIQPQKVYFPHPSEPACRWCHLRTDKGGPCSAWKVVKELRK